MDKFKDLIKNLAIELETELTVDSNSACLIVFDEKIEVQIELNETEDKIIIFSAFCSIPPGKFRENVLTQTLKENDKFPYLAIFGYQEADNNLSLYNFLDFAKTNAKVLSSFLASFVDLALLWKETIEAGRVEPIIKTSKS